MLIFDAHLDLAMNALEWNRDLTRPIQEIRQHEQVLHDKPDRGRGTVCLPEMRRGGVGVCVATQIGRYVKPGNPLPGWHSPAQAWAQTQGQFAWYQALEAAQQMTQIIDGQSLARHVELWQAWLGPDSRKAGGSQAGLSPGHREGLPIGYVLSLEGADSLITIGHLKQAWAYGLRAVGPAHYGPGTYAQGTDATGGLGLRGRELLAEMDRLKMILDVTHLCDESFWEAVDLFHGPIWASHSNCRSLVAHHRQLTDEQIKFLVERDAVIGIALDAWMLVADWVRGKTTPEGVDLKLERMVDHIDHVCQLAGDSRHVGVGSDLDGAFGREQTPVDLDTIADLAGLPELLARRGYPQSAIAQVLHGNFLAFLRKAWS